MCNRRDAGAGCEPLSAVAESQRGFGEVLGTSRGDVPLSEPPAGTLVGYTALGTLRVQSWVCKDWVCKG